MIPEVVITVDPMYGEMELLKWLALQAAQTAVDIGPLEESYEAFQVACRAGIVFW